MEGDRGSRLAAVVLDDYAIRQIMRGVRLSKQLKKDQMTHNYSEYAMRLKLWGRIMPRDLFKTE